MNQAKQAILDFLLDDLEIDAIRIPPPAPLGWPPLCNQPLTDAAFQAFVINEQLESRDLTEEQLAYINFWSKKIFLEQLGNEAKEAFEG
jgi:hypothetical protein